MGIPWAFLSSSSMSNLIGSCTHWAFDDPSAVKTQDVATKPRLMHTSNTHGKLTTQRTRMDHEGQNRPHVHMSLLTTMKFYFFGTTNGELSLCFEGLTPLAMGTRGGFMCSRRGVLCPKRRVILTLPNMGIGPKAPFWCLPLTYWTDQD